MQRPRHSYHWKGSSGDRALADFTRAIELRPNYPTAYNNCFLHGGWSCGESHPRVRSSLRAEPELPECLRQPRERSSPTPASQSGVDDFHRAGMYPERLVAVLGGAILRAASGIDVMTRTRVRRIRNSARLPGRCSQPGRQSNVRDLHLQHGAPGAIRCKVRRHPWHLRHPWHCGLCNLQNLKDSGEFESHALRQMLSFSFKYLKA